MRRGANNFWLATSLLAATISSQASAQQAELTGQPPNVRLKISGGKTPVELPVKADSFEWAPNGRAIALHDFDSGQLCWLPAAGGTPVVLAKQKSKNPRWSPDGAQLLFDVFGGSLMLADTVKGSPPKLIARGVRPGSSCWSPDGQRVAFGASGGFWISDLGGAAPRQVVKGRAVLCSDWAPDGSQLAFVDLRGFLYVFRPDGSGLRQICKFPARRITWSPGSRHLLADMGTSWKVIEASSGKIRTFKSDAYMRPTWAGAKRVYVVEKGMAKKLEPYDRELDEDIHEVDEKDVQWWAMRPTVDISNDSLAENGYRGARTPKAGQMRIQGFVEFADPLDGRYQVRIESMIDSYGNERVFAKPIAQPVDWADGARQTDGHNSRWLQETDLREDDRVSLLVEGPKLGPNVKLALREAWIDGASVTPPVEPIVFKVPHLRDPDVEYDGVTRDRIVVPMVFPVAGKVNWIDSFLYSRDNGRRRHHGQDIMGYRMEPLVACFDGKVRLGREHGISGNCIFLDGDNGWRAFYCHLNDDDPGTRDGAAGDEYAFAPGLVSGMHVHAGQLLGYMGNSGNARHTATHVHFELKDMVAGAIPNAAPSLRSAMKLAQPAEDELVAIKTDTSRASRLAGRPATTVSRHGSRAGRVGEATLNFWPIIEANATKCGVDPLLVAAIIQQESDGDPGCVSHAGAMGLMQLMPGTASGLGVNDPFDPEQNIHGGTLYIAEQLKAFNNNMEQALVAYNAGPARVLNGTWESLAETRAYVPRVIGYYNWLKGNGFSTDPEGKDWLAMASVEPSSVLPPDTRWLDKMLDVIRASRGGDGMTSIENAILDSVADRALDYGMSKKPRSYLPGKAAMWANQAGYKPGNLNAVVFDTDSADGFASEWHNRGPFAGRYLGLAHTVKKGRHYWAVVLDSPQG